MADNNEHNVFRILDLPPELRDLIYEQAAVQNRSKDSLANAALFRVSKQLNREATDIFFKKSTSYIKIIHWNEILGDVKRAYQDSRLNQYNDIWPPALLKMRRIEVVIDTSYNPFPNHILYSLAAFLQRSEMKMQELHVEVKPGPNIRYDSEASMLYPISRMPGHVKIFYKGSSQRGEELVRAAYLDGQYARKWTPVPGDFNLVERFNEMSPKFEAHLAAWKEEMKSTDMSRRILQDGERFLSQLHALLEHVIEGKGLMTSRIDKTMALSIKTLARWVELREAGLPFGEEEIRTFWRQFGVDRDHYGR